MDKNKKKFDVWHVITISLIALYALFLLYPLFCILKESIIANGKFTVEYFIEFFSKSYYFETLINSFVVSVCATVVTLIIGVPLAYFYNMYEIKGKSIIQIIIILCCMSAPFIGAYSWILLLGRSAC